MSVVMPLRFVPPDIENLVAMKVWEGASSTGPFNQIDFVTAIGEYPTYIEHYTTANVGNPANWFALSWIDDKGAETALTAPMQGNVNTLVGEIVQRSRERMPGLSIQVVTQEAEGAIQVWMGEDTDPYDPSLIASYRQKNGLTYLTIARTLLGELLMTSSVESATMSLVSFKGTNTRNTLKNIDELVAMAEEDLGISGSAVLQLEKLCHIYGGPDPRILRALSTVDQEFRFIPYRPWPIEMPARR
jgi:hypothetical protein